MLDRPGVTLARIAEALGDGFSRNTLARFKAGDDADCPIDRDRVARGVDTLSAANGENPIAIEAKRSFLGHFALSRSQSGFFP